MGNSEQIVIVTGYRDGLIGRIVKMHADYYSHAAGFGAYFESKVAGDLAEFVRRLNDRKNQIWTALMDDEIVGSVAIDGRDFSFGIAQLRWFIVDGSNRGSGVGRRLLSEAVSFVDRQGFVETQLWTFRGLDAARHLYEANGFELEREKPGKQWGKRVDEQLFSRKRTARTPIYL